MRSTLALAGLALVAASLPMAGPTHAAVTCQGKLVTISDSDGGTVEGTEGDDVIEASGPNISILAKGGDDTICTTEGYVSAGLGRDSVYVGGEVETEDLDIRDAEDLDVTIGEGGGHVQLVNVRHGWGTVDVSGGAALTLIGKNRVVVDLKRDMMVLDGGSYALLGNAGIFSIARRVELVGDRTANSLRVNQGACKITIKGGRGDDHLEVAGSDGDLPFPENCGSSPTRVHGQRGNDLLQGRSGPDILIGGAGSDEARGGFGTDTCTAERERNCER